MAILNQYVSYLNRHVGTGLNIFDGYGHPSVKEHEHERRQMMCKTRANTVSITLENRTVFDQNTFLANTENKKQLIQELMSHLPENGYAAICSDADADTTIVSKALECARAGHEVEVIGNDTDLLAKFVHHWEDTMADIYLRRVTPKQSGVYSVREVCESLHPSVKEYILFLHVWFGCDSTSHIYGFGKNYLLKAITEDGYLQDLAAEISDPHASPEKVGAAGSKVFCYMYGDKHGNDLASLRYMKFQTMLTEKMKVVIEKLPPSERAAHFHSLRAHFQICVWSQLDEKALDPTEWGWKCVNDVMEPITTDLPPAPENILRHIRCKCKSLKNRCGSSLCSCRKNGLTCVAICGGCHGENCKNSIPVDLED